MGLSEGQKSFRIDLAVLIQYRSVTTSQPPSHVPVAITLNAKASSLKTTLLSSNKIQNRNILVPSNLGPPGKMAIKTKEEIDQHLSSALGI